MFEKSFLLKEVAPISQNLSALGASGLAALDYLDRGERPPDAWVTQQLAVVEQAKKPQAQLLLMVAPSVAKSDPGQRRPDSFGVLISLPAK